MPREWTLRQPRPTEAEFEELKRKRDESFAAAIRELCEEHGWDINTVHAHASHAGECYCDCPKGPCQHVWDGPEHFEENMSSATCSRCGALAACHDMRVLL